jgi:hypothetical protein
MEALQIQSSFRIRPGDRARRISVAGLPSASTERRYPGEA